MARAAIERSMLGQLTKVGQGGQGVVYHAPKVKTKFTASLVYKEYKAQAREGIDFSVLSAMPELVENSLSYDDGERLISMAAWPCAIVEDGGTPTGFVMPEIPDEFFVSLTTLKGVSRNAAEFQHLLNPELVLDARGIAIDDVQRYALLREVASGLAFLHSNGVCVGDISPKNLLFSLTPREAVYFIDCDAMRINDVSALRQVETPGWEVPPGEDLATVYSDTYKLGLLALRLLAGDQDVKTPQHIPSTAPTSLRQIISDTLDHPPQKRPLPATWTYVLGHAIEEAQHRKKTAPAIAPTSLAPVTSRPVASAPPTAAPAQDSAQKARQRGGSTKRWSAVHVALLILLLLLLGPFLVIPLLDRLSQVRDQSTPTQTPTPPTREPVTPVAEAALEGLLLSPDQINTAMGTTGMTVTAMPNALADDSGIVADKVCLPIFAPAEAASYAGSRSSPLRGQEFQEQPGNDWTHQVGQYVVLFSSAHDADAFFTASAQRWPACSNRQYTRTVAGKPDQVWTVGPVSNTNGTLSATTTVGGGDSSWTWNWDSCQRALTVANNVAIDIVTCS
jgi:hypothetical protein